MPPSTNEDCEWDLEIEVVWANNARGRLEAESQLWKPVLFHIPQDKWVPEDLRPLLLPKLMLPVPPSPTGVAVSHCITWFQLS